MIKKLDEKYYLINLFFIVLLSIYLVSGTVIPLQFVVANKFITIGVTFIGVSIGLYNLFVKIIHIKIKNIEVLILFFIANLITSILVIKYGYIANIKNMVVFFMYFFTIFPMFSNFNMKDSRRLLEIIFQVVMVITTIAVVISLIQFINLEGYRTLDYKGLVVRQGFLESRLFGILFSPNYSSIVSLIVIAYMVTLFGDKIKNKIIANSIIFMVVLVHFIYIVLSGSRTTHICLIVAAIVYALIKFSSKPYYKYTLKVVTLVFLVSISYNGVKDLSERYLIIEKENIKDVTKKDISLERTDTSEENISNNRFKIWSNTLKFVPKKPIMGFSSGNWHELSKAYDPDNYIVKEKYYTHNGYLEILFFNGIIGLILMGVFSIKFIISLIKKHGDLKNNNLYIFIVINYFIIMVSNLFLSSTLYGISLLGVILFLIIGFYFSHLEHIYTNYRKLSFEESKKIELEVMDYVDDICRKNDIKYSIGYGTLIGAIRHKGYIPWDDDIDIFLLREEYNKLYDAVLEDKNSRFGVISYRNSRKFPYPFMRVYDKDTFYENGYINSNEKLGICIDVFPIDNYIDVTEDMAKLDKYRRLSIYTFKGIRNENKYFSNIIRYITTLIFRITSVRNWNKKMNELATKGSENEFVNYLMESGVYKKLEKKWLEEFIEVDFEGRKYMAYKDYDKILTAIYGEYMVIPDEKDRIVHAPSVSYCKIK